MIAVVGSHRAEKYTDSETDDMMYVSEAAYKLPDHCRVNYKPNASETGPPRANSAPRSLRRALLMPQVNPGSLYRRGERT